MQKIRVAVEKGEKWTIATAVDWPGWTRRSRGLETDTAVVTLITYATRYGQVLQEADLVQDLGFTLPTQPTDFDLIEQNQGDAKTDFGSPAVIPAAHREPISPAELPALQAILRACWQAFDRAAESASGQTLRTGPRGGGRTVAKMRLHLIESERAYVRKLACTAPNVKNLPPLDALAQTRQACLAALAQAVNEGLPEAGPRGGKLWPPRYFVHQLAWHTLDHAWEIEDRLG
ncbi:MAG: hypothetical protein KDD89_10495 [Anaerolineales bacterium]|nr:hypothetical protein [Anaerolineales bacterium]